MATIEFEAVAKRFGNVAALEQIDLRIEEGEFFTVVGPSGCGKSTLLALIAGLETASAGEIRFDGQAVTQLAPRERDVAMVFQSYALYPHLTVRDNIAFPLTLRRQRPEQIEAAVAQVAQTLGLEALLARRPRELSGGQRQRVALGRALVRRPRVFLLDEPLSNLDARLRLEMRAELKRLHAEYRITTVYVTHDQEEAMALSDRIAVLKDGRLQQCGAPLQVYDDPRNLFVAGFIGSPPINVLEPAPLRELIGRDVSGRTVAAVRPADIRVSEQRGARTLEATVMLCEPTGSEVWVSARWHGQSLMGRAQPGAALRVGAPAYFELPARVFLFDRDSGARVE